MNEENLTINFNQLYSRPPNFCECCGEMLDFNVIVNDRIKCQKCEDEMPIAQLTNHEIIISSEYTYSKEWMNKLDNIVDKLQEKQKLVRTKIAIDCTNLKCNGKEAYYYTMQMRSADEGQTVFYECVKCGHGWSVNS